MINRYRCYNVKDFNIYHDGVNQCCDLDYRSCTKKHNHHIGMRTTTISPSIVETIRSHRKIITMMIRILFLSFPLLLLILTKTITTTTTGMNQFFKNEYHNNHNNNIIIYYATAQTPIHIYDHYHHHKSSSTRRNTRSTRRGAIKSIGNTSSGRNHKHNDNNYFAILHASNSNIDMPWRQYQNNNNNNKQNTQQRYGQKRDDYRSHFIDYNTVMNDKRAQIYNVNLRSRRPNQYSWTSQIVLTTIITFILQSINPSITSKGMKISMKIRNGQELYRLITPILLHGNIFHLMTNMVSLQRVGNDVERLFGPTRYLYTYLLSGVLGNIFSAYQSFNPSLGASGSVFGVVGSYLLFVNQNEWFIGERNGNQITSSIIQTIGMNVLLGFMNPSIDQWAHAGGFIGGALVSYLAGPRLYIVDPSTIPLSSRMNNNNNMIVVDRPMIRLPTITIPKTVQKRFTKYVTEPINTIVYGGNGQGKTTNRPWLNYNQQQRQRQQRQKRYAPNQSIQPRNVDDIF